MVNLNPSYEHLRREYIFPIIEKKLIDARAENPNIEIVNLGIGDIALPLSPHIACAITAAIHEMSSEKGIHGYGPSEGYLFLKERIAQHAYANLDIDPSEIFVSDGINSDISNFQELFSQDSSIGVMSPTYPVYLDTNIMAGRKRIIDIPCLEENGFCPQVPQVVCDVIYLCTPNNPTGVAMTRKELQAFVDYARDEKAILLIDSAYEAFITSPDVPKSIYEIPGAKEVAIEFRSFSKSAGFTGLRCGYCVVPKEVLNGKIHSMWLKRQSTKSNGVSYPIQKGAEAVFSPQGQKETKDQVLYYLKHAQILKKGIENLGFKCYGAVDSPYVWWKTPRELSSWDFFDELLEKCHIVSIPGKGFGAFGEGFVRLSAFTHLKHIKTTLERLCNLH